MKQYLELQPAELLTHLDKYAEESMPAVSQPVFVGMGGFKLQEEDHRIFIDLINKKKGGNKVTNKIIYAINTYLIRNRGVASDFHLIKDVVERNTDAIEEDINQSVSLPLYLGLLGTFLGIVFGLFQIAGVDFAADTTALNTAISLLLDGVKIAMIASFTGLLFMVINSGYTFKGAKSLVEEKKNDFYTFIQTDLLPLLNQNINSTLFSLQSNLHKFNEEFKTNVGKLGSVMGKNYDTIIAQEKILDALQKIDILSYADANVKVLHQLKLTTGRFETFNQYLTNATELVNQATLFTQSMEEMMKRTDNLNLLGEKIVSVFEENQALAKFLQNHYSALDESHQLITQAVNGIGNTLDESLVKLKEFTQDRITEVQKITLKEIDLMESQYPERWKKLDNLAFLETVNKHLTDMKMSTAAQIGSVANEVRTLNDNMVNIQKAILTRGSRKSSFKKLFDWVKSI
ncbi:hypothetical protein FAM09_13140 [Niastella caeni]|uniref:MotA/TolQ/ExbB proton channel domain-containing protein n=1 Tax=Niastella caeni TaxID=2569763 RepID=A0A4S8HZ48_9BACT|nr:hypothetical protein [Niastella caeni]THU39444.1 hypothetical protein FAM09_13140 [Niastella caeni]